MKCNNERICVIINWSERFLLGNYTFLFTSLMFLLLNAFKFKEPLLLVSIYSTRAVKSRQNIVFVI